MSEDHPGADLVPFARGELGGAERARVAAHLEGCARCRAAMAANAAIVAALRAHPAAAPDVDWVRYRAELRGKLDARSARAPRLRWLPAAAGALAAAAALVLVLRAGSRSEGPGDALPPFEQVALGSQLDLLRDIPVVENLEFLEDLDVVQGLGAADDGVVEEG